MKYGTMEHRYTRESERPEYDEKISNWLNEYKTHPWGGPEYHTALYHNGFIYRAITPTGLDGFIKLSMFLNELGLVDILNEMEVFRGYSAVFATPDVKLRRAKGDFNLSDIPKNPPPPPKPIDEDDFFWDDEDLNDDYIQESDDFIDENDHKDRG